MRDCNTALGMGHWDRRDLKDTEAVQPTGHGVGQDISISALLALLTF